MCLVPSSLRVHEKFRPHPGLAAALAAHASLASAPARASLGELDSSIEADRHALGGVTQRTALQPHGPYTVQEIVTTGRVVHEYANQDGRVFAVSWQGRNAPDLAPLLGAYFSEFQEAQRPSSQGDGRLRQRRSYGTIQGPHVVVERSGHLRGLRGRAYVPALLPEGVRINAIQ